MTLDEALKLREGDHVLHVARSNAETGARIPIRVTEVWVNRTRSIVCIRCNSIRSSIEWVDATGYELPPTGLVYDHKYGDWVTLAVRRARKQGDAAKLSALDGKAA